MKKIGLGKRALATLIGAATLLSGSSLSGITQGGLKVTAASTDNYAKALQYSLYFYDANMCGSQAGEHSSFSWRDDCHTYSEVQGGYHDAGDHAMFGLPQGYSASTLEWGYREFGDTYDQLGQTAHLKVVLDHFADFFKASTKLSGDTVTSFCYQKGNGDTDHGYWGPPEQQPQRKFGDCLWTSSGASDIAAEYAAALAAHSLNFGDTEALTYAKALYKFSRQYNQVATEGCSGFYDSSSLEDDQAWAAAWLYLATNDSYYKSEMDSLIQSCVGSKYGFYNGHGWDSVHAGACCLKAEIDGDWGYVTSFLNKNCTNPNTFWFSHKWGTARQNTGLQLVALTATKHGAGDYSSWCKAQMDMILGNNPKNVNLIVGMEDNSSKYPHHRAASGYNGYDEFDGEAEMMTYGANGHTLTGALCGGPTDTNWTYLDSMNDYVCNEVAVDYNAALVGASAGLYSIYKTGSIDANVNGVDETVVPGSDVIVTTPKETTTTQPQVSATDKVIEGEFHEGDDGNGNPNGTAAFDFDPAGAKSVTAYIEVLSEDTQISGAFGTWAGSWKQDDFKNVKVGNDYMVAVDYVIPDQVGDSIKLMIFWPGKDDVRLDKLVLHYDAATPVSTTTTQQNTPITTTTTAKQTTPIITTKQTDAPSADDKTLTAGNGLTVGTEVGDDNGINNFAEFAPQGAKSATLYYDVTSSDTESSGAFGTYTGTWTQKDFKVNVSGGKVAVDYVIPDNVGSTVKAMVFWPHGDAVKIEKVVLHYGSTTPVSTTTNNSSTTSGDKTITGDFHEGDDGKGNLNGTAAFDFAPAGAKSVTAYIEVLSDDTQISGAFGTWAGSWKQDDFKNVKVGADYMVAVDYVIPDQVGDSIKLMIFWPGKDDVRLDKIVLHYDDSPATQPAVTTTTAKATTVTTKATTVTTKTTTTTAKATQKQTTVANVDVSLYGDVNADGSVDIADAVLLNKAVANAVTLSPQARANADVCGPDGEISAKDAMVLLQFLVGVYKEIPRIG